MNKRKRTGNNTSLTTKIFFFQFWVILILALMQSSCSITDIISTTTPTNTPVMPTDTPTPDFGNIYYIDGTKGNDENTGTESRPWQSIKKAMSIATAGDIIIVRGGEYIAPRGGWVFQNSGTPTRPISFINYPNEQVVLKMPSTEKNIYNIFRCAINPHTPESWDTPKADHIRIVGSDVSQRLLSNDLHSKKGIVMQGQEGQQSSAIIASDCDFWEVAGVDFVETASGIFTFKNSWHTMEEHSSDYWYVHDNRVYNFYRESGMQFNGNFNLIENNEIYKVSDRLDTPYGCQMLNLLGNNNTVRGNTLSRRGSNAECIGLLFEWDLSDANLIEQNTIYDAYLGISFQGGDNNIIQNNIIRADSDTAKTGVQISSYEDREKWPCDDFIGSGSSVEAMIPPDNPAHPDYAYYYNPRNCHSMGNQILNNKIIGFKNAWRMMPIEDESNIFLDNITSEP